jgi:hypothetical protein
MTQTTTAVKMEQMAIETDVAFKIIGDDDHVFHGLSKTLSTTELSFDTTQILQKDMLLQMTMASKDMSESTTLQTMVKVTGITPIANQTGFHVNSSIEDMAIGM